MNFFALQIQKTPPFDFKNLVCQYLFKKYSQVRYLIYIKCTSAAENTFIQEVSNIKWVLVFL